MSTHVWVKCPWCGEDLPVKEGREALRKHLLICPKLGKPNKPKED